MGNKNWNVPPNSPARRSFGAGGGVREREVSSMPEKTWLETRKKRTRWYVVFFLIVAVAGVAVFIRNNLEMFLSKSEAAKQEAVISISDAPKSVPKEELKDERAEERAEKRASFTS